jgi:hypothetical protein
VRKMCPLVMTMYAGVAPPCATTHSINPESAQMYVRFEKAVHRTREARWWEGCAPGGPPEAGRWGGARVGWPFPRDRTCLTAAEAAAARSHNLRLVSNSGYEGAAGAFFDVPTRFKASASP